MGRKILQFQDAAFLWKGSGLVNEQHFSDNHFDQLQLLSELKRVDMPLAKLFDSHRIHTLHLQTLHFIIKITFFAKAQYEISLAKSSGIFVLRRWG
jgi:hypothetical protein